MLKTLHVITDLTQVLIDLAQQQSRMTTALTDVACEQRITNLVVRSQITTNPEEKSRLMNEATERMEAPRRRCPHDPR